MFYLKSPLKNDKRNLFKKFTSLNALAKLAEIQIKPNEDEIGSYYKCKRKGKVAWKSANKYNEWFSSIHCTFMENTDFNFNKIESVFELVFYYINHDNASNAMAARLAGVERSTARRVRFTINYVISNYPHINFKSLNPTEKTLFVVRELYKKREREVVDRFLEARNISV